MNGISARKGRLHVAALCAAVAALCVPLLALGLVGWAALVPTAGLFVLALSGFGWARAALAVAMGLLAAFAALACAALLAHLPLAMGELQAYGRDAAVFAVVAVWTYFQALAACSALASVALCTDGSVLALCGARKARKACAASADARSAGPGEAAARTGR